MLIMFGSIVSLKTALRGLIEFLRHELQIGVSMHFFAWKYPQNVEKMGIASIVKSVLYALDLPFATHADIVIDGEACV